MRDVGCHVLAKPRSDTVEDFPGPPPPAGRLWVGRGPHSPRCDLFNPAERGNTALLAAGLREGLGSLSGEGCLGRGRGVCGYSLDPQPLSFGMIRMVLRLVCAGEARLVSRRSILWYHSGSARPG